MFQPRLHRAAVALTLALLLAGCGAGASTGSEAVESFDAGSVGPAPLVITTTTLPPGVPGVQYPVTPLDVQGTGSAVVWRITAGLLPDGIWLTTDGRLLGTPTEEGFYEFTAQASDGIHSAEQDLALAIGTFGLRATDGLMFGDAWTNRPVALRCAGHGGSVAFRVLANRSGGRLEDMDGERGTAFWRPGPFAGEDVLEARDATTGATDELVLEVVEDPTATHQARFGDHDTWYLNWHAKHGAHPFATDLRAALARLGLRSPNGHGLGETEADRLAELAVQVEILRKLNPMFLRNADGTAGPTGLPIAFAFERPGAGYVAPVGGSLISGRANGYSVMALCEQGGTLAAMGVAFGDAVGNPNHEHNAPGGAAGPLGVFVDYVAESVQNIFRLHGSSLRDAPVDLGDVEALKAILHGRPSPGGRYELLQYQIESLATSLAYVTAHEVGHSLGLAHAATYVPGGIMNATGLIGPGIDYHFTSEDLAILRAGLPGAGRTSAQALTVGGVTAMALAPSGMHVCGDCSAR